MTTYAPFQCLCGETSNVVLFEAGQHTVRRCTICSQVYITGINLNTVQSVYDKKENFIERNAYVDRWYEFSRLFEKIVNKIIKLKPHGALLDVGCSVGILLDVARKKGFVVKGVEVSTWASEFAKQRGFDVTTGGLLDAAFPEKSFDVIVLNHVLEHLPKPIELLGEAKRILKDDGLLVIGVPNFGSYMATIKKASWASLQPDQHIWQFTHELLLRLLLRSGFSEVFFEAKDNHRLNWLRIDSMLFFMINIFASLRNNGEAMLLFARKAQ